MKHLSRQLYDSPRDPKKLWLDCNECNCQRTRNLIKKIFRQVDYNRCTEYPALYKLYGKLAEFVGTKSPHLLLTHGADHAIRIFFEHNRGHRALIMRPTFAMNEVYAHYYCNEVRYIDYDNVSRDADTLPKIIGALGQLKKDDIFVLASPDSPIGVQYTKHELWNIADICRIQGVKFLVDETYILFGNREHTMIPWIDDTMSVCHSFSKSLGLAGTRLGYLVSKDQTVKDSKHMKDIGNVQAGIMEGALDNIHKFLNLIDKQIELRDKISTYNGWSNTYGNYVHANKSIVDIDKLNQIAYTRQIAHPSMKDLVRVTLPNKLSCIQSILN